ncbi:MAG TPA: glycosyltransferase family 2 protein [Solirubrobacteraceae bacterium]|jgi:cellulose synthase/poly-beta-1,6-N-acetylglucosamine synthase-like glycosyltransferase|nr:glycosyltransferase family 2 protein [Solirubrobacteraceae bacterium]
MASFPHYEHTLLAGALTEPPEDGAAYEVRYRSLLRLERKHPLRTILITLLCMSVEIAFVVWLLAPQHFPSLGDRAALNAANIFVVVAIGVMELMRMANVVSLAVASLAVRNPIPVRAPADLRVAFATTIVPSKEPLAMVRRTLRAARAIEYAGTVDVWLLDEEDDGAVKEMCAELGVRHFTRRDVAAWNRPAGPYKAKSKHGNYNAWLAAHGGGYDVLAMVDPDHVPVPNYLERLLGYFRDPDVAYVVGPQNYANCNNFVTMGAESQQFPFHSVIQRAANLHNCAMLVGTNNAMRVCALQSIGGLRDSVTEDMATGFQLHTRRNAITGRRWKSVYTPDVLAHGEGPACWTDYFSQQMRWSRGTFEVLRRDFWRRFWRLQPGQLLHYGLISIFYPSMAIAWILGAIGSVLYLAVGASGIDVPVNVWLALYVDTAALQFALYVWNRRYNVSPYEVKGSFGLIGMLMSVLSSPLYASALIGAVLRRPARFVITPKGDAANPDRLSTFRRQLQWGGLIGCSLVAALILHHASPVVCFWPLVACSVCLTPIALWRRGERRARAVVRSAVERAAAIESGLLPESTSALEISTATLALEREAA